VFAHIRKGKENSIISPIVQALEHEHRRVVWAWDPTAEKDPMWDPKRPVTRTFVFVNGDPIGYTDDVHAAARAARQARRCRLLPYDTSVSIGPFGLSINTDVGIMCFPVVVVENIHKWPSVCRRSEVTGENIWALALQYGVLEYIDTTEAMECLIAFTGREYLERCKTESFTHIFVHSCAIMGISAAMTPFSNHNQGP